MPKRLEVLYEGVQTLVKQYAPDRASVETLFFFKNAKTVISVGQARGVILLALSQGGVPIYEYTPLQVKQTITSHGRASKEEVQEMVKHLLSLEEIPKPDDAADALAIALCHHRFFEIEGVEE